MEQALLEKYRVMEGIVPVQAGCWENFLGLNTRAEWFPHAAGLEGKFIGALPVPDDGVYGGATEYISLLRAIDSRSEDKASFSAIEIGAGWGPWVSAAGVVCKRLGFANIRLVAVEAEKAKAQNLVRHLTTNGLIDPSLNTRVINGAAWSEDTVLYFPRDMPMQDYGGAVSTLKTNVDYRGMAYPTDRVSAYSLPTICSGLDIIDYAHWDVQGAEWTIAANARDFINARVRYLFIGTHSRQIEGNLLGLFYGLGWNLLTHTPCHYQYDRAKPSLEAMTGTDGEMFFENTGLLSGCHAA